MCLYISIADQQHSNVHEMFGHHFTPSFTHTHTQSIYAIYIDKSKMHFKTSLSKGTCDDLLTRKQLQQLDVLGSVLFPFSHQKICRSILPKHESDFCESKCLYTTVPSGFVHSAVRCNQPGAASGYIITVHTTYVCIHGNNKPTCTVSGLHAGSKRAGAPSSTRVAEARALNSTREGALGIATQESGRLAWQTLSSRKTLRQTCRNMHVCASTACAGEAQDQLQAAPAFNKNTHIAPCTSSIGSDQHVQP